VNILQVTCPIVTSSWKNTAALSNFSARTSSQILNLCQSPFCFALPHMVHIFSEAGISVHVDVGARGAILALVCSANRCGWDRFISLWLFSSFGRLFLKFSQRLFQGVWFITFVVYMIISSSWSTCSSLLATKSLRILAASSIFIRACALLHVDSLVSIW